MMGNVNGSKGPQGLQGMAASGLSAKVAADLVFHSETGLEAITSGERKGSSAPSQKPTLKDISAPPFMEPDSATKPQLPKLSAELANRENQHFSEIAGRYGGADQTVAFFNDILQRLQVKLSIPVGFSSHYEMCVHIDNACQQLGLVDILKDKGTGGLTDTHINQLADILQRAFVNMPKDTYIF